MADDVRSVIEVKVDLSETDISFKDLARAIGTMQTLISNLNKVIWSCVDALNGINASVQNNGTLVKTFVSVWKSVAKECTTYIVTELKNLTLAVGKAEEAQGHESVSSTLDNVLGAIDSGTNIWEKYSKQSVGKYSAPKKDAPNRTNTASSTKAEKKPNSVLNRIEVGKNSSKETTKGESIMSGIVSGGLADLGNSFPDATAMEGLAESIGTVANKLKESAIQWGLELKAKAASRLEDLKIIAINTVEHVKAFGLLIAQLAASAGAWIAETAAKAASTAAQWAQIAATTAWQVICVAATAVTTAFGAAVAFLTSPIGLVIVAVTALIAIVVLLVKNWDTVKATVLNVWDAIMDALGSAWQWLKTTVLDPLVNGFKDVVNGIIGFINGLIEGAVKGINGVIGLLNKLQFTVPDWVPGLGGKTLGFDLKLLSAPQIPYLAKGAVLPANRPFLAVVGDQRHGTNVEAPLATIQEAVALVLEDHIGAMMAGFEALLKEQQATRRTIEGIEIGDTVIGRAAERYGRKIKDSLKLRSGWGLAVSKCPGSQEERSG